MKSKYIFKMFLVIISLIIFPLMQYSFARDTDLYLSSGEGVEPNILIMFDSSGSMGELVPAPPYSVADDYAALLLAMDPPVTPEVSTANRNVVYSCTTSGSCGTIFKSDISLVTCA